MTEPKPKPPKQIALAIEKGRALAPAPQPLFDGGPKAPMEGRHKPFQFLAWEFHRLRFEHLGDRYFAPWDGKHQRACQKIVALARGDMEEVKRRMRHLWLWCRVNPDFYRFTPQCLLGKWDDLHQPPLDSVGGHAAVKQGARQAGREAARRKIDEEFGDG
jgi:hypothetical protein